MHYYRNS